ncbi:hypothetical protein D9M71_826290 [compost metagenome]
MRVIYQGGTPFPRSGVVPAASWQLSSVAVSAPQGCRVAFGKANVEAQNGIDRAVVRRHGAAETSQVDQRALLRARRADRKDVSPGVDQKS